MEHLNCFPILKHIKIQMVKKIIKISMNLDVDHLLILSSGVNSLLSNKP